MGEYPSIEPVSNLLEDDGSLYPETLDIDAMDDLAVLPFSNGTTGRAKPVMLTHYNMVANVEQIRFVILQNK